MNAKAITWLWKAAESLAKRAGFDVDRAARQFASIQALPQGQLRPPNSFVERLQQESKRTLARWEWLRASQASPFPVMGCESIRRQVFHPIHLRSDGSPKPDILDDYTTWGASTDRSLLATPEETHRRGQEKAENDRLRRSDRQYMGFVDFSVSHLRSLRESGDRLLCVFDTATDDWRSHADVVSLNKAYRQQLRFAVDELVRSGKLKIQKP